MPLRFNHMELTLPPGRLTETRDEIRDFYADLLGWTATDIPILGQSGLLLRTDDATSQFILVTEQRVHIDSPGYDHLGLLCDTRAEVDALLAKAKTRRAADDRVQIKEYDDLVTGDHVTHAFYVRFLLPIWFDIQCFERAGEPQPDRWTFT
ncbi:MAG: hypothetical protein DHS20C19_11810 [Acidimicrobiales bacterium]|nr:MAG: hypothetical protein DHS20C19_11810 [Acidimicrobiales bacterium]